MREKFEHKKPGDDLSASFVNRLSGTVERLGRGRPGTNARGKHGGSSTSNPQKPPFDLVDLIISNRKIHDDDDERNGLYKARIRYYYHSGVDGDFWFTDDSEEWLVDARDSYLRFEVDASDPPVLSHRITAYWNEQRGAFIPISRIWPPQERKVKLTANIAVGASGTANVWENGAVTSPAQVLTVWLNWMAGVESAESGDEAMARWIDDEDKWVVVNLECA